MKPKTSESRDNLRATEENTDGCAMGQVIVHSIEENLSLLVTPLGKRFMLPLAAQKIKNWLARTKESASIEAVTLNAPDIIKGLVEKLMAEGCLTRHAGPVDPVWLRAPSALLDAARLQNTTIVLTGDTCLANLLATAMSDGVYKEVRCVALDDIPALQSCVGMVVIAAFKYPALDKFRKLEAHCAQENIPWIPVRYQDGRVFAGPAVVPGDDTVKFEDVFLRRRAAERDVRVHDVSWGATEAEQLDATFAEWQWVAATVAIRVERWIAGAYGAHQLENELELDLIANTITAHPVLPLPNKAAYSVPVASKTFEKDILVDAQTGVITQLREVTGTDGLPKNLKVAVADVADMERILDWANDRRAFGASWTSLEAAFNAARGEAVERYCGNWIAPDREIRTASYASLIRAGEYAVDPDSLALYSEQQYQTKGFPFEKFSRDSKAGWVLGWSLTHQRAVWVPAFLVYVTWHTRQQGSEPLFCYPNLTGIAAGATAEYAMLSGLEEVVERDTGMIWWAHAQTLPCLPITDSIRQLYADVADRFELRLIPLENEFSIPVLVAAVRDRETGWITIGSAVRHIAADGAYKALAEAFSLQQTCRSLDNPQRFSTIVQNGAQNFGNLKPWRQDRAYLDSYRSDFHDVVDLMCQQQLNLDRRAAEYVSKWVWAETATREWESLPALPSRTLDAMRARVEGAGYEVISVDVTSRDIAVAGFHVRRTLVPGLVANFPAAFPQWGAKRIQQAGVSLGWRNQPCAEGELNIFPIPHA